MVSTNDNNDALPANVPSLDVERCEELLKEFEQQMGFPLLSGRWSDGSRPTSPVPSLDSVPSGSQSPVLRPWNSSSHHQNSFAEDSECPKISSEQ